MYWHQNEPPDKLLQHSNTEQRKMFVGLKWISDNHLNESLMSEESSVFIPAENI